MSATHASEPSNTAPQQRLLSEENQFLQRRLESFVVDFCRTRAVFFHGQARLEVPAYGLSSELAARTPIRLYDHPALMRECDTAFTDGSRVFISAALFKDLWEEHVAGKRSLDFVLNHELDHIRLLHTSRLLNCDGDVANRAADTRINIDAFEQFAVSRAFFGSRTLGEYENKVGRLSEIYETELHEHGSRHAGHWCGLQAGQREKWGDASSEQIAMRLLAEAANQPKIEISDLLSQVARDMRDMADRLADKPSAAAPAQSSPAVTGPQKTSSGQPQAGAASSTSPSDAPPASPAKGAPADKGADGSQPSPLSPDALHDLADKLDRAAAGQASRADLEAIAQHAADMNGTEAMRQQDLAHRASAGVPKAAADVPPSIRSQMAGDAAKASLDPNRGAARAANDPGQYQSSGTRHYVSPEELDEALKRADAHALSQALGYDTPESIASMKRSSRANTEHAIRSAANQVRDNRGRYPGAHRVESAMRDLEDFSKPVLDWKMKINRVLRQESGKRQMAYTLDEPWMPYSTPAADMGFASQGDVPYLGSHRPVKPKKNLVVGLIDTSGSTSDILHSLTSEALGLARKHRRDNSPELLLCAADTVVRGRPVRITERNVGQIIASGLALVGGGGTDFLAPLVSAVKATEKGGVLEGRKIDHIIYFSDGECHLPPRDKLPEHMPPVLFVVPVQRYQQAFDKAVRASEWADVVFYDPNALTPKTVDVSRPKGVRP